MIRAHRPRVRQVRIRAIRMQPCQLIKIGAYPQAGHVARRGPGRPDRLGKPRIDPFVQVRHRRIQLHTMGRIAACRMAPHEVRDLAQAIKPGLRGGGQRRRARIAKHALGRIGVPQGALGQQHLPQGGQTAVSTGKRF